MDELFNAIDSYIQEQYNDTNLIKLSENELKEIITEEIRKYICKSKNF